MGAIKSAGVYLFRHKVAIIDSNSQQLKPLSKSSSQVVVTNSKSANYNGGQYIKPTAFKSCLKAKRMVVVTKPISSAVKRK